MVHASYRASYNGAAGWYVWNDHLHVALNVHVHTIQSLYYLGFPGSNVELDRVQNDLWQ